LLCKFYLQKETKEKLKETIMTIVWTVLSLKYPGWGWVLYPVVEFLLNVLKIMGLIPSITNYLLSLPLE
jgi:hypothetical protein